jgi:hypothetical protein
VENREKNSGENPGGRKTEEGVFVIKGSVSGKTGYSFEYPLPYAVVEKQWGFLAIISLNLYFEP